MSERQPWEQLPKESGKAYRAFVIYQELGPERTLAKVVAALSGAKAPDRRRASVEQAPDRRPVKATGQIRKWAKDFRWAERASAHDHYLSEARDRARAKQVESKELRRARLREQQEEETLVAAQQLKLRAFEMLGASLTAVTRETRTVSDDGHTTIVHQTIEPAGWRVRDTALLLKVARELEDAVLHPERSGIAPSAAPAAPPPPADLAESDRRLAEWRAEQRRGLLTMDLTRPPGEPPAAPAPPPEHAPDPARRNGSGVPPVPASSA